MGASVYARVQLNNAGGVILQYTDTRGCFFLGGEEIIYLHPGTDLYSVIIATYKKHDFTF